MKTKTWGGTFKSREAAEIKMVRWASLGQDGWKPVVEVVEVSPGKFRIVETVG